MKKELPGIFKKNVDASHSNNKKIYYTSEEKKENAKSSSRSTKIHDNSSALTSVEEKIRDLFKSSRYIFNINVLIKTNQKDYHTRIAGKVKNSIVTVDGEVIPIIDITDIIIKDRL